MQEGPNVPIYEYECENKHRFEKWQSMKDDPIKECPECGTPVHKILHPAGIIFKGSGWYITDSRKSGSGESSSGTKSETKSDKSETKSESSDSKSETKPKSETKSESKSGPSESTAKSD